MRSEQHIRPSLNELLRSIYEEADLPDTSESNAVERVLANVRETGSGRKAADWVRKNTNPLRGEDPFNLIPSEGQGACHPILIALCFDGDSLKDRLNEAIKHAGIHCPRTKLVVFVTTHWKASEWAKVERDVNALGAAFAVLVADGRGSFVRVH